MTVSLQVDGGIAELVLDRPDKLNAVDRAVMAGLAASRDALAARDDVRCLILHGRGRAFSVGADRELFSADGGLGALADPAVPAADAVAAIARLQADVRWIAALPYPTVAAVHGHALGLGLELALLCDLRLAARDAGFAVIETEWGVVPDGGATWFLPRVVGAGRAAEMVLTGRRVDAADAERTGLVNRVVDDLLPAARELAAALAARPSAALGAAKQLVGAAFDRTLDEGLAAEADQQVRVLRSGRPTVR